MAYTKHPKIRPLQAAPLRAPTPVADDKSYYSRPATACDIWFDGNNIVLGFPPNAEHVRGHSIKIPVSNCNFTYTEGGALSAAHVGWKAIYDVLYARAQDRRPALIARPGAITGYQLEQILKNMSPVKYGSDNKRITTLADLGLE